ncbi:MAG: MFS transporter [Nitratireductor sp.]|nr:MFS transporter [Nitratireductor sp.]
MRQFVFPIFALMLGSAFLMVAGGINGLILPLRGSHEGFSALSLGLLGTGWAIGYVTGCIYMPRLVRRAGHVRTFSTAAALAVISVLLSLLLLHPGPWVVLRALAGFSFAGGAMIVESWLNERTEERYRGRVFGLYTMVNLGATMVGQMLIATGDTTGYLFFVLAAVFYALAVVPTAVSTAAAPRPLVEAGLDMKALWRNSPLAVGGALLIGISNSAFGTLGVVFGNAINLEVTAIAAMMSVSLLAGTLFQIPVGILSDKMDRRFVLLALVGLAMAIDLFFIIFLPSGTTTVLLATAMFGAAIYSVYPVIIAHASDHAVPGNFIRISGGLLLLYGTGAIIGPLIAGSLMALMPQRGMFLTTLLAHGLLFAYGAYRVTQRDAVSDEDKGDFVNIAPGRLSTPETMALDPRSEEAEIHDWAEPGSDFPEDEEA